jgi:hypothetical protein
VVVRVVSVLALVGTNDEVATLVVVVLVVVGVVVGAVVVVGGGLVLVVEITVLVDDGLLDTLVEDGAVPDPLRLPCA